MARGGVPLELRWVVCPLFGELVVEAGGQLVAQKTGIAEEQARTAVMTVLGFLKDRLPGPLAGQLDGILGGSSGSSRGQDLGTGLGDLLSRK